MSVVPDHCDQYKHRQLSIASVRCVSDIPPLAICGLYPDSGFLGINCQDRLEATEYVIEVHFNGGGHLVQVSSSSMTGDVTMTSCNGYSSWLMAVRAARDRHEQNAEVFRDNDDKLRMRTVRPVRAGEELLVWYSDERARECGVPILTPSHIRGNQQYTCTQCSKYFQYPNTLKSHLLFHCRPALCPSDHLINRLIVATPSFPTGSGSWQLPPPRRDLWRAFVSSHRSPINFDYPIKPLASKRAYNLTIDDVNTSGKLSETAEIIDLTLDKISSTNHQEEPRTDFHLISTLISKNNFSPSFQNTTSSNGGWKYNSETFRQNSNERIVFDANLHVEIPRTSVSSEHSSSPNDAANDSKTSYQSDDGILSDSGTKVFPSSTVGFDEILSGTSSVTVPDRRTTTRSRGPCHTCVYCGKVYSRKYGLTIHLRTHSGYKPLKCKVCLRPFGDPSNLNKHVRLHAAGDTPYRCRFCGKVLVRRRDLERHIRSRHPNNDIVCREFVEGATAIG